MAYGELINKTKNLLFKMVEAHNSFLNNINAKEIDGDTEEKPFNISDEQIQLKDLDHFIKLDFTLKEQFERAFGADLHEVKIHTGKYSEQLTRDHNAQAITIGSDIYFAKGKYSPDTEEGTKLLAHEIQHVIQNQKKMRLTYHEDIESAEYEAEKAEELIGDIRLHNLNGALLDQSKNPDTSLSQSKSDNYVALHKGKGGSSSESIEDFSGKNIGTVYEITLKDGSKIQLNKMEYEILYSKFRENITDLLSEQKFKKTEKEFNLYLKNFFNTIN